MSEKEFNLHPLLIKQLKRSDLDYNEMLKVNGTAWEDFINRISHIYYDNDQERYLLERSLNISSREMTTINQKLEYAQKLARLGYWLYNQKTEQFSWSTEMYFLSGLEPSQDIPEFSNYINMIREEFRPKFMESLKEALAKKETREVEIQFKNKAEDKYFWHHIQIFPEANPQDNNACHAAFAIVLDITKQKESEESLKNVHQQMLELSRQVGMSEVATAVLHNIGNIMNSVNISLGILTDSSAKNYPRKLSLISQMLKDNLSHLPTYISQDEKGKLIPGYFIELAEKIHVEYQKDEKELKNISDGLKHINDMITNQLFFAKPVSALEEINVDTMIDASIQMALGSKVKDIVLNTQHQKMPSIWSDKSKLMQILVNLLRNAYESTVNNTALTHKEISIKVNNNSDTLQIVVSDNGEGIKKEYLNRIFTFGFTTKEKGHGFGLHSSALAAKDLHATLQVQSDGLGKGATFILSLPADRIGRRDHE